MHLVPGLCTLVNLALHPGSTGFAFKVSALKIHPWWSDLKCLSTEYLCLGCGRAYHLGADCNLDWGFLGLGQELQGTQRSLVKLACGTVLVQWACAAGSWGRQQSRQEAQPWQSLQHLRLPGAAQRALRRLQNWTCLTRFAGLLLQHRHRAKLCLDVHARNVVEVTTGHDMLLF